MADVYAADGTRITCNGQHFCDAVNDESAAKTAAVLNAYVQDSALSYREAEVVGEQLRHRLVEDRAWNSLTWADAVQTTLRLSRAAVAARNGAVH